MNDTENEIKHMINSKLNKYNVTIFEDDKP